MTFITYPVKPLAGNVELLLIQSNAERDASHYHGGFLDIVFNEKL